MSLLKYVLLSAHVCALCAVTCHVAAAQSPVKSQSEGGITEQVLDARWVRDKQSGKNLIIKYKVIGNTFGASTVLFDQNRVPITSIGIDNTDEPGVMRMTARWLNPSVSHFYFGSEWLDPSAPGDATGRYVDAVDFANITLPATCPGTIVVNKTATSSRGAIMKIEKLVIEPIESQPDLFRLRFVFKLTAPPTIPDAVTSVTYTRYTVDQPDTGDHANYTYTSYSPIDKDLLPGRQILPIETELQPNQKVLSIRFLLEVSANSLRKEEFIHRILFDIPPGKLPGTSADSPFAPRAVAQAGGIQSTLESLTKEDNGSVTANIWMNDTVCIDDFNVSDEYHQNYVGYEPEQPPLYWRMNGVPAAVGKRGHTLNFHRTAAGRIPAKLKISLDVHPIKRIIHTWTVPNVPIPKVGEIVRPMIQSIDSTGNVLTVVAVQYFDAEHPMSGLDDASKPFINPSNGIAIELEYDNKSNPVSKFGEITKLQVNKVRDSSGTRLDGRMDRNDSPKRLVTNLYSKKTGGTWLLLPPGNLGNNRTMDMNVSGETDVTIGAIRQLAFTNISEPAKQD